MNTETSIAHLLIVDDNPMHMTALSDTLMDAGYKVTGANMASAALSMMRSQKFDLVLTDLRMPEMDGIEFLRRAQEFDANLVGIVMTGHAAVDTAIDAMKAGALDYILKPFKLGTILPVLKRGLEVRHLRMEIAELQKRVREHVVELESANKELEAFSYSVSHDLRAPLRVINGVSSVLVESYAPQMPGEAQQLLGRIRVSADHMGQLIDHLLEFASLSRQPLSKQMVDIAMLVNEVLDMLRQAQGSDKTIVVLKALPVASGDGVLLRQVFINLLSNAFKFSRRQPQPRVTVGCMRQGDENVYYVSDNGDGFDMQQAGELFKVFHRLHRKDEFEGTGVGLALVQRIVQRHGGRIWAEGEKGKGATFYFTLEGADNPAVAKLVRP